MSLCHLFAATEYSIRPDKVPVDPEDTGRIVGRTTESDDPNASTPDNFEPAMGLPH